MKVLGINGSHRRNGNTKLMLEEALKVCSGSGFKVKQIDLVDNDIKFCTVCDACKGEYTCPLDDDVMEILEEMKSSDAIIVGSPTYFGGVSGKLRALFDRTLPLRRNGMMLAGKIGGALAVGGSRNGGQEHTIQQIHAWMLIQEMTIVGDRKTAHFGGICWAHKPGSVIEDKEGLETVVNLAEKICAKLED
jgi:multimeric flavodoxin WrbA